MPLKQKMGRPGSLLPRLDVLSILPYPPEHRRISLGLLKAIAAPARGVDRHRSDHVVPACAFCLAGDQCRTCAFVYDVHSGPSLKRKVRIFPGSWIDLWLEIFSCVIGHRLHFVGPPCHCYEEISLAGSLLCFVRPQIVHLPS